MTATSVEELKKAATRVPPAPRDSIGELLEQDAPVVPCDDLVAALRDLARWEAIDITRVATFLECEVGHDGITRRAAIDLAPALAIAWRYEQDCIERHRAKREVDQPSRATEGLDFDGVADAIALCDELIDRGGPDVSYPSAVDLATWLHNQHDRKSTTEALLALAPIVRRVWERKQRETDHDETRSETTRTKTSSGA